MSLWFAQDSQFSICYLAHFLPLSPLLLLPPPLLPAAAGPVAVDVV
jgi:hypothetical protein